MHNLPQKVTAKIGVGGADEHYRPVEGSQAETVTTSVIPCQELCNDGSTESSEKGLPICSINGKAVCGPSLRERCR